MKNLTIFLVVIVFVVSSVATPLQTRAQEIPQENQQRILILLQLIEQLQELLAKLQAENSASEDRVREPTESVSDREQESDIESYSTDDDRVYMSLAVHNRTQAKALQYTDVEANYGDEFYIVWDSEGYNECTLTTTKGHEYSDLAHTLTGLFAPRPGTSITIFLTCEKDLPGTDRRDQKSITITTSDPGNEYEELG